MSSVGNVYDPVLIYVGRDQLNIAQLIRFGKIKLNSCYIAYVYQAVDVDIAQNRFIEQYIGKRLFLRKCLRVRIAITFDSYLRRAFKCGSLNLRRAVRHKNIFQLAAASKGISAYVFNAVGDHNIRKLAAAVKGLGGDLSQSVADG